MSNLMHLLEPVCALAREAGQAILAIYGKSSKSAEEVSYKPDGSPLIEADRLSDSIISDGLARLTTPAWPVLSEESTDIPYSERANWTKYWLVDPLDGTKEFLERTDDFTVNIALIEAQHPVMGVVYAPVLDELFYAAQGQGAWKQQEQSPPKRLHARQFQEEKPVIVASRRHADAALKSWLERVGSHTLMPRGSSLKFCLLAEGLADVYPRFGVTSEWDTAAAQCILEAAGGAVLDLHGLPLHYNTSASLQNPHFIAYADPKAAEKLPK